MKTKKLISFILVVVLMFTLAPFTAITAGAEEIKVKEIASKLAFDEIRIFNDGLAVVRIDRKYGYIDKTGKIVIPVEYYAVRPFSEGLAVVCKSISGKYGVIDKTGKVIIPLEYDCIYPFSEGLAAAYKGGKMGFIDKTNKTVIEFIYDGFDYAPETGGGNDGIYQFVDGLARVEKGGKCGYIDKTGKVIVPFEYDIGCHFSEGLAVVGIVVGIKDSNDLLKYGYIDKTGKIVIPIEYDAASDFIEGLAYVSKAQRNSEGLYIGQKGGFIDKTGKMVLPTDYDGVGLFKDGLATVLKGEKFAIIDKTGKIVIPFADISYGAFIDGLALARKDKENQKGLYIYGYIDKTGKVVVPFDYVAAVNFSEGVAAVQKATRNWSILEIVKPQNGTPLGDVLYSDIVAYINGEKIPTSIKSGTTMVVVEDLARYGFDVVWNKNDRTLKVELNKNKKIEPLPVIKDTTNKPGTFKCKYVYTDIKTYLSGQVVESFAINGVTLIDFELLVKYGTLQWDGKAREIRLVIDK